MSFWLILFGSPWAPPWGQHGQLLYPSCGEPQDLCDAEKKKLLDEFMALDSSKRDTMIKALPSSVATDVAACFG